MEARDDRRPGSIFRSITTPSTGERIFVHPTFVCDCLSWASTAAIWASVAATFARVVSNWPRATSSSDRDARFSSSSRSMRSKFARAAAWFAFELSSWARCARSWACTWLICAP